VKLLRLWLLVLLAVLLPVRGALAATMPCGPASMGGHGGLQGVSGHGHPAGGRGHAAEAHHRAEGHAHHHHHHGQHQGQTQHQVQSHAADPGQHGTQHDPSGQDRCSLCAACCAGASLPSAPLGVDEPPATASVPFPGFSAPSPTFQSDGLERPPRST
jgi:hypothetical protein